MSVMSEKFAEHLLCATPCMESVNRSDHQVFIKDLWDPGWCSCRGHSVMNETQKAPALLETAF